MNHQAILKRAWKILFSYKTLWVFGIILALTTITSSGGGGGGSSGRSNSNSFNLPSDQVTNIQPELERISEDLEGARQELASDLKVTNVEDLPWAIIIPVSIVLFLLMIGFAIVHVVSKVALIRMVNDYEVSEEKLSWKQGFRLGWSRAAWRLFLINLVIGVGVAVGVAVVVGCISVPFLLGGGMKNDMSIPAMIAAAGLIFLFIFAGIFLALVISLMLEPAYRACVLEDLGVFESISRGWRLVRANLKNVVLMWLLLIGIQIAYVILIIPVALIVGGIGLLIGGGLGVLVYLMNQSMTAGEMAWIPAAIVGGLIFLAIFGAPLAFLGGLKETYLSTAWTLTYREMRLPLQPGGNNLQVPEEGAA